KVLLSNASIHSLIERAEAVYKVNSGVGLEALLHEKPVVVTGKCDYMYAATVVQTPHALRTKDVHVRYLARQARTIMWYARRHLWTTSKRSPRDSAANHRINAPVQAPAPAEEH